MKLVSLLIFLLWVSVAFAATPIGEIIKIRGEVFKNLQDSKQKQALKEKDSIFENDIIVTAAKSFVQIQMIDETTLSLGADSHLVLERFSQKSGKRDSFYNMAVGQLRAHVKQKAKEGESLVFKTGIVPLGVRGTEFLSTALNEAKPTVDAVVLSGKVDAAGTEINPGQVYNSEKGIWKTLGADELKELKTNKEAFLPESLLKGGASVVSNVGNALAATTGALASQALAQVPQATSAQTSTVTVVEKHIVEVIKVKEVELPVDIKDALKNREKFKALNRCFYWEYKIIPGSYVEQRFRRERDCDDYQEGR